jgi:hypothetical protein
MKSVEDRIVAATVHGIIAAVIETVGSEKAKVCASRSISIVRQYLAGEVIDGLTIAEVEQETVAMLNDTFGEENTDHVYN